MEALALKALQSLDFGSVDAESEKDLNHKFLRTEDFNDFLKDKTTLVVGAKGSGKSAIFELLTKYESTARDWSSGRLDDVFIVEGSGFRDATEIDTDTIEEFRNRDGFGYSKLWKLYFSVKLARKLYASGVRSKGASSKFLKTIGDASDYRILPILRNLWGSLVGRVPKVVKIPFLGEISIGYKWGEVSPSDVLYDLNDLLGKRQSQAWIVLDKIDEIFPMDAAARNEALSHLMQTCMECQSTYKNIKFRVFLRSDIWASLSFTNKTHLSDKTLNLRWDRDRLRSLLLKRALVNDDVLEYCKNKLQDCKDFDVDTMRVETQEAVFYTIFDSQIYKGANEATSLGWMIERATDSLGGVYPREMIMYGNISSERQVIPRHDCLIEGASIRDAYYEVSRLRCENYLAEFPAFNGHFEAFSGKTTSQFSRDELVSMFKGLEPRFEAAVRELSTNVGLLRPLDGKSYATAERFQIPRLYVAGLGIVTRGRP